MIFWDLFCDSCDFYFFVIFVILCDFLNFQELGWIVLSDTV